MARKQVVVLICDLYHRRDKPAVATLEVDVCTLHRDQILRAEQREMKPKPVDDQPINGRFACQECGRTFNKAQGRRMHLTMVHGVAPATKPEDLARRQEQRRRAAAKRTQVRRES